MNFQNDINKNHPLALCQGAIKTVYLTRVWKSCMDLTPMSPDLATLIAPTAIFEPLMVVRKGISSSTASLLILCPVPHRSGVVGGGVDDQVDLAVPHEGGGVGFHLLVVPERRLPRPSN